MQSNEPLVRNALMMTQILNKFTAQSLLAVVGGTLLLWGTGCAQIPVAQQRHVAKSEMTFQASAGSHPGSNLIGQIEPGSASSGGAQAAGCTSCR